MSSVTSISSVRPYSATEIRHNLGYFRRLLYLDAQGRSPYQIARGLEIAEKESEFDDELERLLADELKRLYRTIQDPKYGLKIWNTLMPEPLGYGV